MSEVGDELLEKYILKAEKKANKQVPKAISMGSDTASKHEWNLVFHSTMNELMAPHGRIKINKRG